MSGERRDFARRVVAVCFFTVFVCLRAISYRTYFNKVLWLAETGIFAVMVANYCVRMAPKVRSQGFWEQVYPFFCAAFPFLWTAALPAPWSRPLCPPNPWVYANPLRLGFAQWVMAGGTAFSIYSMAVLGRSFGITVAARAPVLHGPYRWIRHPVYLGEMVSVAGMTFWRFGLTSAVLLACFVTLQTGRAFLEERKLSQAFPEYREWQRRTGMFFPKIGDTHQFDKPRRS